VKSTRFILIAIAALALVAVSIGIIATRDDEGEVVAQEEPAHVEAIDGTELSRVTLTQRAAERLDIQTAEVTAEEAEADGVVIPYAALIYDSEGNTWVYTSPENLVYVRHAVTVERIEGDNAYVSEGPDAGTRVVTVGGAMLFGTEFGVGH
jgi:hypothetical protein